MDLGLEKQRWVCFIRRFTSFLARMGFKRQYGGERNFVSEESRQLPDVPLVSPFLGAGEPADRRVSLHLSFCYQVTYVMLNNRRKESSFTLLSYELLDYLFLMLLLLNCCVSYISKLVAIYINNIS